MKIKKTIITLFQSYYSCIGDQIVELEDEAILVILQGVRETMMLFPIKPNFFFPPLLSPLSL
jgi:hypothetical protein